MSSISPMNVTSGIPKINAPSKLGSINTGTATAKSGGGMSGAASAGIQAGINAASGVMNSLAGASNKVGETLNTIGDAAAAAPPPYGLIASGVLKTAGFIANAFTDSVNEQQVKQKNAEIGASSQQLSHATTYEDLVNDVNSFSDVDLGSIEDWGSKGLFVSEKNSARTKAMNEAARYKEAAIITRNKNLVNTQSNIQTENLHDAMMNIVAKGGKIQRIDVGLNEDLTNRPISKRNRLITRRQQSNIMDFKNDSELDNYLKEHNLTRDNIEILEA